MAVQSLYRQYRPRRFSELKGQAHVVRALRDAVASGREGQAYLFSGPRGTGKTTSARILAKVLNCERPVDGEPCCECESCLAVEQGTSYDVHELDAASNNGVDAMRDLIEKASLGTPGRHRVYILDEVHMLSRAAEAALLKTLEEPPSHVVFVLATTDPQKVSETIRSRTQHLRFHLLPADTLDEHVRWVAADAGLDLDDDAIAAALVQGGGSARDTLSAIELIATAGEDPAATLSFDELATALAESDAGRALTVVAQAIDVGRDPRTVTEELIRHLRNGFLTLMAPELVQLPSARVDELALHANRLGAPTLVRGIEILGEMLVEMRHAPDSRLLLEVALVRLCRPEAGGSPNDEVAGLADRLSRLEHAVDTMASTSPAPSASAPPPEADPATGRATLGGRARRAAQQSAPATSPPPAAGAEPPIPTTTLPSAPTEANGEPGADERAAPPSTDHGTPEPARPATVRQVWDAQVLPSLKPIVRALYSTGTLTDDVTGDRELIFELPNEHQLARCSEHADTVKAAVAAAVGGPVSLTLRVAGATPTGSSTAAPASEQPPDHAPPPDGPPSDTASTATEPGASTDSGPATATGPGAAIDEEESIDLDELIDAPPETATTPYDRLTEAFPGSELIDDPDN